MSMQKRDIKETITAQIIDMIKDAQATGSDFTLPFKTLGGKPTNALTRKAYRGMNALWLGMLGIRTVATYNQWQTLGYQVQKGSKSVGISVPMIGKDKKTGENKMFGFRGASVFPASQVLHAETGETSTSLTLALTYVIVLRAVLTTSQRMTLSICLSVTSSSQPQHQLRLSVTTARYCMSQLTVLVIHRGLIA